jgi:hypothetical protein
LKNGAAFLLGLSATGHPKRTIAASGSGCWISSEKNSFSGRANG